MTTTTARPSFDMAAWALVALVVAAICGVAGWAWARQDNPGRGDLDRYAVLAAQDGAASGLRAGYRDGAALGRREARARARIEALGSRREAFASGRDAGIQHGRNLSALRAGDPFASTATPLGAFAATGGEEFILSEDLTDVPGFATSAYSSYGVDAGGSYGASPYGYDAISAATSTGPGAYLGEEPSWIDRLLR